MLSIRNLTVRCRNMALLRSFSTFKKLINPLPGTAKQVDNTNNVVLRGTMLKGRYNDLPNLIWFPEACDPIENWINFFTNPECKVLDYRNVWLVNPRNFGNSDRNDSFDIEEMSNDVVRFMYEHKISTATLGGHGFGGKLALAAGCYHHNRVTGVINLDTAPLDHRYHEAFREFREYVVKLGDIDFKQWSSKDVQALLHKEVLDPKWRSIFTQNIVPSAQPNVFQWNFNMDALKRNLKNNKADSIGYWSPKIGLWTGRYLAVFPEYSRWVFLNTNTLAINKICLKSRGFGQDVFYIQGDENPLNHWIYELKKETFVAQRKIEKFLALYDGVHTLLSDRTEVGRAFIPDVRNSRKDNDHYYSEYSPLHVHHNWRYSDIYNEDSKKN